VLGFRSKPINTGEKGVQEGEFRRGMNIKAKKGGVQGVRGGAEAVRHAESDRHHPAKRKLDTHSWGKGKNGWKRCPRGGTRGMPGNRNKKNDPGTDCKSPVNKDIPKKRERGRGPAKIRSMEEGTKERIGKRRNLEKGEDW